MSGSELRPMMRQYWEFKAQYKDSLLFFRLGDFYELFFEDAEKASKLLGLTLTSRDGGGDVKAPMCGLPYHSAASYIGKLLKFGEKVAICEQVGDPSKTKGLVKREVIRVYTPGTVMEGNLLDEKSNNYIAALAGTSKSLGIAYADLSTGEFRATSISGVKGFAEALAELIRISPAECLVTRELMEQAKYSGIYLTPMESPPSPSESSSILLRHFSVQSLAPFGCDGQPQVTQAAAALLNYLGKTHKGGLSHITTLKTYSPSSSLRLDPFTLDALEVVDSRGTGEKTPTLLSSLDKTVSGPGSRVMRNWLLRPLYDAAAINARLDAVSWLVDNERLLTEFRGIASSCPDLERIASRIGGRNANARDLVAVKNALQSVGKIRTLLSVAGFPAVVAEALSSMEPVPELDELLSKSIADEPPAVITEGGLIKDGWNPEVDELRGLSRHGKDRLMEVQARERERTGIENLKVQYNSVFGYFIEVSKGKTGKVPPDYQRKQTLTGAERYITPELKELESKILGATERLEALEKELFTGIREQSARHVGALLSSGRALGILDALSSYALVAMKRDYVRPTVEAGGGLEIIEGRHPVLEQLVSPFVSNDIHIVPGEEMVLLITGPNMAGKSTYLRQNALIALMAHAGCFVPAKSARIGLFDGIYCRIGASDRLTRGQSTFMVEMTEVAHILNHATRNSLLVFDEVGRGTSTYDGISIAWSILEHVAHRIGAGTLFATHYYELTALAGTVPGVRNYNVLVREWKNELVFLYKIVPGRADRSYGVQVAKLAGIPGDILTRARELLQTFEKKKVMEEQDAEGQMALFGGEARDEIASILRGVEPERMTPVQALTLLSDLKERLGSNSRTGEGNA